MDKGLNIDWSLWAARVRNTKVDFKCDFDAQGLCREERKFRNPRVGCCCKDCGVSFGFLRAIPKTAQQLYQKRYDPALGFWRPDKGCILPRVFRSQTCLHHYCSSKEIKGVDIQLLSANIRYPLKKMPLPVGAAISSCLHVADLITGEPYVALGSKAGTKTIPVVDSHGRVLRVKRADVYRYDAKLYYYP